jgi:hypothetical protein
VSSYSGFDRSWQYLHLRIRKECLRKVSGSLGPPLCPQAPSLVANCDSLDAAMMPAGGMYEEWRTKKPEIQVRDKTRFRLTPAVEPLLVHTRGMIHANCACVSSYTIACAGGPPLLPPAFLLLGVLRSPLLRVGVLPIPPSAPVQPGQDPFQGPGLADYSASYHAACFRQI